MDPRKFRAPFIPAADIEARVEELRAKWPSLQKPPIDVLSFAEFDLGLEFDYADLQRTGMDALLRRDLKGIVFDKFSFNKPYQEHRVRFSAAHELAHLYLHQNIYGQLGFDSIEKWVSFVEQIPPDQYHWIEWQADQFAGYFLIPTKNLQVALNEAIADAGREGFYSLGEDMVLEFCARSIHRDFGVSKSSMETRIRKSPFWPPKEIIL